MIDKKKYEDAGTDLGKLVGSKQEAYGNAVERSTKILEVLYPNGIPFEQFNNALLLVRITDKMVRIATNGDTDPMRESPFRDIAGYGLLGNEMQQGKRS